MADQTSAGPRPEPAEVLNTTQKFHASAPSHHASAPSHHASAPSHHASAPSHHARPQDLSLSLPSLDLSKHQNQRQGPPTKPAAAQPVYSGGPWGRDVTAEDLRTVETLHGELFPRAVALGWFGDSEDERRNFVALACVA